MGRTNNNTSLRGNEVQYPVSLYNLREKIVHGNMLTMSKRSQ